MFKSRIGVLALASLSLAGLAGAQATGANGAKIHPRDFNDVPGSLFTGTVNWPVRTITLDDQNVSASTGFANRHLWFTSNDAGATDYGLSGPNDFFNMTSTVDLTASGGSRKEAGFFLRTGGSIVIDGQFMLASDNGEVAIFGGAFPFYSFTAHGAPAYVPGTAATIGLKYFRDSVDSLYKFQYMYDGFLSPAQQVGDVFATTGLSAGTHIGGYLQVTNVSGNPTNFGTAVFTNVNVGAVPEPASCTVIALGALALIKRRRAQKA